MLEVLRIKNYAIISELEAEFSNGFTTITGETGAGKSILIGALKLVLGERANADIIRTGEQRATVEALFRLYPESLRAWLQDQGLVSDDGTTDELLLRRDVLHNGTSRCYINGISSTQVQMRLVGEKLVDIHGQHENTSLFSSTTQLRMVDAQAAHDSLLASYDDAYREYRSHVALVEQLSEVSDDAERRKAFLEFQINELSSAGLCEGEEESLETERRRLQNAEKLINACTMAIDLLTDGERGETSATSILSTAGKFISELVTVDPSREALVTDLENARFALEDLSEKVRDYCDEISADPARLAEVDDRLQLIKALKRKYGASISEMLALLDELRREHNSIQHRDEELEKARSAKQRSAVHLVDLARQLSERRIKAALQFSKLVLREVRELELPKAQFEVQVTSKVDGSRGNAEELADLCSATGADEAEFLVSINPGETMRPLKKVASGGEITRIMLAIKSVLAERDDIPSLVFDEIDTGISGEAAARVGDKLLGLGETHQVICITHLPQIAARGVRHIAVEKESRKGRTNVSVRLLEGEDRAEFLARMLSGEDVDETTRQFAERLLRKP